MDTTATTARQHRNGPGKRAMIVAGALAITSSAAFAAGPLAYVPSNSNPTFSVVDLSDTGATPATFTVDGTENTTRFYGAALSPKDGNLYISDQDNETVFRINPVTNGVSGQYFVGSNPRGIAVDESGRHVYVANFASAGVSVIDTSTGTVGLVDFGNLSGSSFASPSGIALNLSGTRAYVTDGSTNQRLCQINTVSLPESLTDADCIGVGAEPDSGASPNALAVSPDATRVYVVNHNEATVTVVDALHFTVIRTFPLGFGSPNGIAISRTGKRGYVGTGLGNIVVFDTAVADNPNVDPVLHLIPDPDTVILSVQGLAVSLDGTHLLAVDSSASKLHVINIAGDPETIDASVPVNENPLAMGQFTESDAIFVGDFEG